MTVSSGATAHRILRSPGMAKVARVFLHLSHILLLRSTAP